MQDLFNPMLGREAAEILKLDRVHKIIRYQSQADDRPRDVIVRFHFFEEKSKIIENIQKTAGISNEGTELQVFSDLSAETMARRRLLKPLTEQMRTANVPYQWGFPA